MLDFQVITDQISDWNFCFQVHTVCLKFVDILSWRNILMSAFVLVYNQALETESKLESNVCYRIQLRIGIVFENIENGNRNRFFFDFSNDSKPCFDLNAWFSLPACWRSTASVRAGMVYFTTYKLSTDSLENRCPFFLIFVVGLENCLPTLIFLVQGYLYV